MTLPNDVPTMGVSIEQSTLPFSAPLPTSIVASIDPPSPLVEAVLAGLDECRRKLTELRTRELALSQDHRTLDALINAERTKRKDTEEKQHKRIEFLSLPISVSLMPFLSPYASSPQSSSASLRHSIRPVPIPMASPSLDDLLYLFAHDMSEKEDELNAIRLSPLSSPTDALVSPLSAASPAATIGLASIRALQNDLNHTARGWAEVSRVLHAHTSQTAAATVPVPTPTPTADSAPPFASPIPPSSDEHGSVQHAQVCVSNDDRVKRSNPHIPMIPHLKEMRHIILLSMPIQSFSSLLPIVTLSSIHLK